jgi:hypothetical protein
MADSRLGPSATPERPSKWRTVAGAVATLGFALTLFAGTTLANFIDREYTDTTYSSGIHNLQISTDGSAWVDTSADGVTGDNPSETSGVQAPLTLDGTGPIVPGDPITAMTWTFYVRNSPNATLYSSLTFFLATAAAESDHTARDAMLFTVCWELTTDSATNTCQTGQPYSYYEAGVTMASSAPTGNAYKITITAWIPDQGSAALNRALANKTAQLVMRVQGSATAGRER